MANNWNIPATLEAEIRERDKACVYCGNDFLPHQDSIKASASWEHIIRGPLKTPLKVFKKIFKGVFRGPHKFITIGTTLTYFGIGNRHTSEKHDLRLKMVTPPSFFKSNGEHL